MTDAQANRPEGQLRRSFVYRQLAAAGASFAALDGAAVARDFGDLEGEAEAARRLGLADLSPLARTGFKGAGTAEWLTGRGLVPPETSNRATRQGSGLLAARLAPSELMLLGGLDGDAGPIRALEAAWAGEPVPPAAPRGFPMPRADSHAWFRVTGEGAAAMFAKLCGVDLRPHVFADLTIAQTQLARLSAIVVRDDLGTAGGSPVLSYHLLFDSASGAYLWDVLIDAMAEFQGRPVGLAALRRLAEGGA